MSQQVSDLELEFMKIIWDCGGTALYSDIAQGLADRNMQTTKNTIVSLLLRLIDKGFLKTNKIGRKNKYTAIVTEGQYQAAQTETFLNKVYEGNAKDLVSNLLQKDLLSPADIEELKRRWEGGGD